VSELAGRLAEIRDRPAPPAPEDYADTLARVRRVLAAEPPAVRPADPRGSKISKEDTAALSVDLVPTHDVLSEAAAQRRDDQIIIGFAAEHGPQGVERARGKLERKNLDAIVVNDISRPDIGFDSDYNEVAILGRARELHVPRSTKEDVAVRVLDFVQELRIGAGARTSAKEGAVFSGARRLAPRCPHTRGRSSLANAEPW